MGSVRAPLVVDIGALRRQSGEVRSVRGSVVISGLETTTARVRDGAVEVDLTVENVVEGVVAKGRVDARIDGECRRCLEVVTDHLDLTVHEIFELHPTEGETWPIVEDHIDLEPVVRESVLLALPLAPLCREDCVGPQPDRFPTGPSPDPAVDETPVVDPRWAALEELRFDE